MYSDQGRKIFKKIVNELIKHDALTFRPGHKYQHFTNFKKSLIQDFDIYSSYTWIKEHKKKIRLEKLHVEN